MSPLQEALWVMRLNSHLAAIARAQSDLEKLRDELRGNVSEGQELLDRAKAAGTATERA